MKQPPTNSALFTRWFAAYSEWLLKRHFHSVRTLGQPALDRFKGRPLVLYANHPSWWDPIVGMAVWRHLLRDRTVYAPIDADMLEKYAFFKRLGFFGVTRNSMAGARDFLRTASALLTQSDTLLFITPQGRFADVREPRPQFVSGLSHVAAHNSNAVFIPMAAEFSYWEEKRPEILIRFGEPTNPTPGQTPTELNALMEQRLAVAQAELTSASVRRDAHAFRSLFTGGVGTNLIYDSWRRLKATLSGKTFSAAHGTK